MMDLAIEPKIPTIIPISKNFALEKGIKILCEVLPGASRFVITLQCSKDIILQGNTALQICFNLLGNTSSVNSRRNGVWDEELNVPGIPFRSGDRFQIVLVCDSSHYKVLINGEQYCTFPQNVSQRNVTYLTIIGDVTIVQIGSEIERDVATSFGFDRGAVPLSSYSRAHSKFETTVLLNDDTPDVQSVSSSRWKQYAAAFGLILLLIIIILCAVLIATRQKKQQCL